MTSSISRTRKAAARRSTVGRTASAGDGADASAEAGARARILATARRHFFALGFASCTMDSLATELGMSKKTLYRHFRSKEEIVSELMQLKAAAVRDGFEAVIVVPDVSFAERAARMMRHAHEQFSEVSAVFLHDLRRFHPTAYARLEEFRARVAPGIWERLLRSGMAEGAVRADVDPVFVGRLIPVVMQSLLHPETLQRLTLQPHEMMERFFQLLFCGVLTPLGIADYAHRTKTGV